MCLSSGCNDVVTEAIGSAARIPIASFCRFKFASFDAREPVRLLAPWAVIQSVKS